MKESKKPKVLIDNIEFKDGSKISLNKDDIVVFVGANNVGKSKSLKEVIDSVLENEISKVLIEKINFIDENFTKEKLRKYFLNNFLQSENQGETYNINLNGSNYYSFNLNQLNYIVESNHEQLYKFFITFMDTENRLILTQKISLNNINNNNAYLVLQKLEANENYIDKINNILSETFDRFIEVAEEQNYSSICKKYVTGNKVDIESIKGLDRRKFIKKAKNMEELNKQGDGVRSAVGTLASLITSESSIYLIDEPESFLHPPQARMLGKNIVDLSTDKQCLLSTHNIDLIRGLIESGKKRVKIIKIERQENNNSFKLIENETIETILNDKNLKYSNILNGLFYKRVVLTENESDSKFYSALLENLDEKEYQNTLFCGVGGKDQFKKIIPLLKKLEIQYLVIADLDIINNNDKFKDLLISIGLNDYNNILTNHKLFLSKYQEQNDNQVKSQSQLKLEINKCFDNNKFITNENTEKIKNLLKINNSLNMLKKFGVSSVPSGICTEYFEEIVNVLKENNIFILKLGEIENIIKDFSSHGDKWVDDVFNKYNNFDDLKFHEIKSFIKEIFNIE